MNLSLLPFLAALCLAFAVVCRNPLQDIRLGRDFATSRFSNPCATQPRRDRTVVAISHATA